MDNTYVQIAQILLHLVIENSKLLSSLNSSSVEFKAAVQKNKFYLEDIKIIIEKAVNINSNEVIFLLKFLTNMIEIKYFFSL